MIAGIDNMFLLGNCFSRQQCILGDEHGGKKQSYREDLLRTYFEREYHSTSTNLSKVNKEWVSSVNTATGIWNAAALYGS